MFLLYYMCFYNSLADDFLKIIKPTEPMLINLCSEIVRN